MVYRFKENRVRRAYTGGKQIDEFLGKENAQNSNCPEEWLASAVTAFNPDYEPIENDGLSVCQNGEFFKNVLEKNTEKILKNLEKGLICGLGDETNKNESKSKAKSKPKSYAKKSKRKPKPKRKK